MPLFYNIDNKYRFLVIYQDVSQNPTRIHHLTGIPLSTINDWIRKIENDQDILVVKSGRGCKKKITDELKGDVIDAALKDPYRASTRKLGAKFGISKTSTDEILKEEGLVFTRVDSQKTLDKDEKDNRVDFCEKMLTHERLKNKTFYSDETGITLSHSHPNKAWAPKGKRVKAELPKKDIKLNIWAAISTRGSTSLEIYKENLNANNYYSILDSHTDEMTSLYPKGFYLLQDNLSSHQSATTWVSENEDSKIKLLDFPTYSPDLNPVENVWSSLKEAVARDAPRNEKELIKSLNKNWEALTSGNFIKNLIESLPTRFQECMDIEGERLQH